MRQTVRIFSVQDRRSSARVAKPWVVRWEVGGRRFSRSFKSRALAERFRSQLSVAVDNGEPFDAGSGEPIAWMPAPEDLTTWEWVQRWLADQWADWQPRTRASAVEALSRFVPLVVRSGSPAPPRDLRRRLPSAMTPGETNTLTPDDERWLRQHSRPIRSLDRECLAEVERRLGLGVDGAPLGPSTAGRYRKVSHSCIRRAVDLGILPSDPWPPPARGRSQRKNVRTRSAFDPRVLPDAATMRRAIDAIETSQPGSRKYRVMTAVAYYAGLRPSEVVMLRASALHLPPRGWGRIDVVEADIAFDVSGEPKTGPRSVPIPPVLVDELRAWLTASAVGRADLMFRTRTDKRPSSSNWTRAWHRALREVGQEPLRIYDCRHAAATTWLRAGVPLGEAARRLGHSVETLVSTYVGVLTNDEELANERIDLALSHESEV